MAGAASGFDNAMSYAEEFAVVDLIIDAKRKTSGVDAFALSVIKAERQMRRLFTHLVFQYPCFSATDVNALRKTLSANRDADFNGFVKGIDAIYPLSIAQLVGERHPVLWEALKKARLARNKIFHGQVTKDSLGTDDLLAYVTDVRCWCQLLSEAAMAGIGYDGFERNSFRKTVGRDLPRTYRRKITSIADYAAFLQEHVGRSRVRRCP